MTGYDRAGVAAALGSRLAEIRRAAGLSQYDVAERAGVKQNRVSDHETGQHLPQIPMLIDYSDVYRTTVAEIVEGIF